MDGAIGRAAAAGRSAFLIGAVLGVAAGIGGCKTTTSTQGRSGVTASYRLRTLTVDLPPEVGVMTAQAAAEEALRARGYVVTSSEATTDRADIEANRAGDGFLAKTVVSARVTDTGMRIAVRNEPLGDEAASRSIMDALLVRLGR